jgi:hypothetical protein
MVMTVQQQLQARITEVAELKNAIRARDQKLRQIDETKIIALTNDALKAQEEVGIYQAELRHCETKLSNLQTRYDQLESHGAGAGESGDVAAVQRAAQRRRTIEDIFNDVSVLTGEEEEEDAGVMSQAEKQQALREQQQGMTDAIVLLKSEIVRRDNGFRQQLELGRIHVLELERRQRDRQFQIQDLEEQVADYEHKEKQRLRKEGARLRIREFMKELHHKMTASSAKIVTSSANVVTSAALTGTLSKAAAENCLGLIVKLEVLFDSIRNGIEGGGGGDDRDCGSVERILSSATSGASQLQQLRLLLRFVSDLCAFGGLFIHSRVVHFARIYAFIRGNGQDYTQEGGGDEETQAAARERTAAERTAAKVRVAEERMAMSVAAEAAAALAVRERAAAGQAIAATASGYAAAVAVEAADTAAAVAAEAVAAALKAAEVEAATQLAAKLTVCLSLSASVATFAAASALEAARFAGEIASETEARQMLEEARR